MEEKKYMEIKSNSSFIVNIFKYFDTCGVNLFNAKNNVDMGIYLYVSKLENASMRTLFYKDKIKIVIDHEHLNKCSQKEVLLCELTHELLHAVSSIKGNRKKKFGFDPDDGIKLTGIDEACTQLFAEKVNNISLGSNQNYLYEIKKIIDMVGNLIGNDLLSQQYFNNNTYFSDKFNELTENKFKEFCDYIDKIYNISKKSHYEGGTLTDIEDIEIYKNKINSILKVLMDNQKTL